MKTKLNFLLFLIIMTIFFSCEGELIVRDGTGSGTYSIGTRVPVVANDDVDSKFYRWDGGTDYQINDRYSKATTVYINRKSIEIGAVNIPVDENYQVILQGAIGEGTFSPGALVTVKVDQSLIEGETCFRKWSGDTQLLSDLRKNEVTFRMPRNSVKLIAEFDKMSSVTVVGGSGSGKYCPDQVVNIKANSAETGYMFDRWVGDVLLLSSSVKSSSSFKMPERDVSFEATYSLIPTPTPLPTILRLIAIGDSITQEKSGFASWRCYLWEKLNSDQSLPEFVFVGSQKHPDSGTDHACPYSGFTNDNEGHWGWTTDEVLNVLRATATGSDADVAVIHMGTNDINRGHSNESTVNEIGEMINVLRSVNPKVRVFVAGLIPNVRDNVDHLIRDLNNRIKIFAPAKSTEESPVIFVDQYSGFNPDTDLRDRIHPSSSGNQKMAQKWYEAIEASY